MRGKKIIDQYTGLYTPEKRYALRHPEQMRARQKRYKQVHKEKYREYRRTYLKRHSQTPEFKEARRLERRMRIARDRQYYLEWKRQYYVRMGLGLTKKATHK